MACSITINHMGTNKGHIALTIPKLAESISVHRWALAIATGSITPVGSVTRYKQNPWRS